MSEKKTTRWTVRVPPNDHIILRDGTIVRNTSPHSTAYLKIEMEVKNQSHAQENHAKSKVS